YSTLVATCALAYAAAGMDGFNAINHAMSTVATGGLSTHDTSFARYTDQPAVPGVATVFMFIGALPFSILILLAVRGRLDPLRDPQIRVFAGYVILFAVAVSVCLRVSFDMPFLQTLTHGVFNTV